MGNAHRKIDIAVAVHGFQVVARVLVNQALCLRVVGKVGVHLAVAQRRQTGIVGRVGNALVAARPVLRKVKQAAVRHRHLAEMVVAAAQGDPTAAGGQVAVGQLVARCFGCGGVLGHIQAEIRLAACQHLLVLGAVGNTQNLDMQPGARGDLVHQVDQNTRRCAIFVQIRIRGAVGVCQHGKDPALAVELLHKFRLLIRQRNFAAGVVAAVFFGQGAAPARLGTAQLCQGAVDQALGFVILGAHDDVAFLLVKGFQHPLVFGGAHTVADGGVNLPLQQRGCHQVVVVKIDRLVGKAVFGGKIFKADVAVVAGVRHTDLHPPVAVVVARRDAAVTRLDGKHRADAAGRLGRVDKAFLSLGGFAQVDDKVEFAVFQHLQHTLGVLVIAEILVGQVFILGELLQNVIVVPAGAVVSVKHIVAVVAVKPNAQMMHLGGSGVSADCGGSQHRHAQQHAQCQQKSGNAPG